MFKKRNFLCSSNDRCDNDKKKIGQVNVTCTVRALDLEKMEGHQFILISGIRSLISNELLENGDAKSII